MLCACTQLCFGRTGTLIGSCETASESFWCSWCQRTIYFCLLPETECAISALLWPGSALHPTSLKSVRLSRYNWVQNLSGLVFLISRTYSLKEQSEQHYLLLCNAVMVLFIVSLYTSLARGFTLWRKLSKFLIAALAYCTMKILS